MKQLPRTGTFVVPYGHTMTMTGGIVKLPPPLEKEIQADIVKLLKTVGAAVYKIGTTRKKRRPSGHDADAWDSRPGRVRGRFRYPSKAYDQS